MKTWSINVFLVALTLVLRGQEAPVVPSFPHPIVARAPEFARWTITYESVNSKSGATDAAALPPAPVVTRRTVVTKTGDIRHEDSTLSNGEKIDLWCKGLVEITAGTNGGLDVISDAHSLLDTTYTDYSKSDFTNLDWIATNNYTGTKTIIGKSCWAFQKTLITTLLQDVGSGANASTSPPSIGVVYIAYIDRITRLPVQLKIGQDTVSYEFQPPPTEMQALPAKIANDVSSMARHERALSAPLPRPF